MQQQEIHKFLERYFLSNKCEIVDKQPRLYDCAINH